MNGADMTIKQVVMAAVIHVEAHDMRIGPNATIKKMNNRRFIRNILLTIYNYHEDEECCDKSEENECGHSDVLSGDFLLDKLIS